MRVHRLTPSRIRDLTFHWVWKNFGQSPFVARRRSGVDSKKSISTISNSSQKKLNLQDPKDLHWYRPVAATCPTSPSPGLRQSSPCRSSRKSADLTNCQPSPSSPSLVASSSYLLATASLSGCPKTGVATWKHPVGKTPCGIPPEFPISPPWCIEEGMKRAACERGEGPCS